jgi:uncharacterized protein
LSTPSQRSTRKPGPAATRPAAPQSDPNPSLRSAPGGITLRVRVQPRASSTCVVGFENEALKLRVTAPPVDSAANAAVVDLIAEALGVRRSQVRILQGANARTKLLSITGIDPADARIRLGGGDPRSPQTAVHR